MNLGATVFLCACANCKLGWAQTLFPKVQEQDPCGPRGLRADSRMGGVGSVGPGVVVVASVSSICMSVEGFLVASSGGGVGLHSG